MGLEFWAEISFLSGRRGKGEDMDGHIHPLCAPADFGAKPRLTTGRIFFSQCFLWQKQWQPMTRCPTKVQSLPSSPEPPYCSCNPCCTWNPSTAGSLSCSTCCSSMELAKTAWVLSLAVPFLCDVSRRLMLLGWAGSEFQILWLPDWGSSFEVWRIVLPLCCHLSWTCQAVRILKWIRLGANRESCVCYQVLLGFFQLVFRGGKADCGCISVGLVQYHGCKTANGSEDIVTNLFPQKKSTVRFCPVPQSVAVQLTVHICVCLSPICIF